MALSDALLRQATNNQVQPWEFYNTGDQIPQFSGSDFQGFTTKAADMARPDYIPQWSDYGAGQDYYRGRYNDRFGQVTKKQTPQQISSDLAERRLGQSIGDFLGKPRNEYFGSPTLEGLGYDFASYNHPDRGYSPAGDLAHLYQPWKPEVIDFEQAYPGVTPQDLEQAIKFESFDNSGLASVINPWVQHMQKNPDLLYKGDPLYEKRKGLANSLLGGGL